MPHDKSASISYPTPIDFPSHKRQTSVKSHKSKQSSLSGTMSWLSGKRGLDAPYTPAPPPLKISEPRLDGYLVRPEKSATVTIVRTPQEALRMQNVRGSFEQVDARPKRSMEAQPSQADGYSSQNPRHPPPTSPPLPPLPEISARSPARLVMQSRSPLQQVPRPVPSPSYFKASNPSSPNEDAMSPLMEMSPPALPPPPFEPILLSTVPPLPFDSKKTIVTLETSTSSFKTTMATLVSRENCRFNEFFSRISTGARKNQHSEASSVYSQSSGISSGIEPNLDPSHSIFADHITASGLLAPTPVALHVFLDRPSAPYTHVLTYLRTPTSPDQPGVLPRPLRLLHNSSPAKIEALLELRDEANFLNLEELSDLCTEELHKYTPFISSSKSTNSTTSGSTKSSKRPSITHAKSLHQLRMQPKNSSTNSFGKLTEEPDESFMPTPNSSAPSSREGSRHEATATPTPTSTPPLAHLRGHGKSFSHSHTLPPSKSTSALRSNPSDTVKLRPSPAWL